LVAQQPDITLAELQLRLAKAEIKVRQSSIFRFLRHAKMTFKKRLHAEQDRSDVAADRRALQTRQPRLDPKKLVFVDETSVASNITRLYGRAPRGKRSEGAARQLENYHLHRYAAP
jgi:hypothetical protein